MSICKRRTVTTQAELTQSNKKKKNLDQLLEQEKGKLIELELVSITWYYSLRVKFVKAGITVH